MILLTIDPGCVQSAYVVYDSDDVENPIQDFGISRNDDLILSARHRRFDHLAIEMVASYGMPVGREVFETVVWTGRFIEATEAYTDRSHTKIYRKDVKIHLCNSMRAKDGNVRQSLIDRFGPQGTKKEPGILYGISKDVWSALAIAVTYCDQQAAQRRVA